MVEYPIPINEEERLLDLINQDILDTEAEEDFDRITKLAKSLFDVPVAIISFIDKDRQWFKSCIGVDIKETSRDVAFCAYSILSDDVLVILNAEKDERFKNNPLVTGETNIRFYAGAPIKSEEGFNLGTVCIIDTKVRKKFDQTDQDNLRHLAALASNLIISRKKALESEDKNLAKTEFLSHISHELRTPLSSIVGISRILRNKTQFTDRDMGLINSMAVSADSLMELINAVLDLSSIESRNFTLTKERFSFKQLFGEIESMMSAKAQEKSISFMVDYNELHDMYFEGDKLRLKQILLNLVGNAIKFTNAGAVTLKAGYNFNPEDIAQRLIEFQVIDTGIGIPEDKIEEIFGRFEQAHANKDYYQGTGLGLYIAKELAEKMGGNIRVESRLGFGTKFFVTIPDVAIHQPTKINSDSKKMGKFKTNVYRILLVEDFKANLEILSYLIEDFGYSCDMALNGKIATEKVANDNYDLVLMDINMPHMDGIEATKIIRQKYTSEQLPIIGMSAHIFEKEKNACADAGMNDYVTKPVDSSVLFEKIKFYLEK